MTAWSANLLMPGFPRDVTGFDLRKSSIRFGGDDNVIGAVGTRDFHATLDANIWPQCSLDTSQYDVNGFNLFDNAADLHVPSATIPDCILVCFDLPRSLVERIRNAFGVKPAGIETLSQAWKFIGFDVVDIRTQLSAIFSFEWNAAETDAIRNVNISMNRYGLIDDEWSAVRAACCFDGLVKEHAPFAPCGVWYLQE